MKKTKVGQRVGILGGGQLARMLAQSAQQMGAEVHILSPKADDPAAQVTGFHHLGNPDKPEDLRAFLKQVDVLTFESEFFDMTSVRESAPAALSIFPSPELMRELQDRRTQKALLEKHKIPTAAFMAVTTAGDLAAAWAKFPQGFVLKKARGGYDGFGTFYSRHEADLDLLARDFPGASIAESFVRFKRELAAVAVCGEKDFCFLPLIESRQTKSRCDWVVGPVKHPKWKALSQKIRTFLKKTGYRGVIAFELFDTGRELLVNEIAPRVHNSGHYSMNALTRSQFDLHWSAGLGLRFEEPNLTAKAFVMTNLLGESDQDFEFPPQMRGALHWYGKKQNRPGRKMGHVNFTGADGKALLRQALSERKRIGK